MTENLGAIRAESEKSAASLQSLTSGVQGLAGALGFSVGIAGMVALGRSIAEAGDQATQLKAKLNLSVGDGARAYDAASAAANRLGVETATVAGTMSRLGLATQDLHLSQERVLGLTETLARMGAVSGATGAEVQNSMTQLSQALSKGRFDGDELKTVFESMPPIMRALADSLGVPIGTLRDLGSEGKLTAEVVVNALEGAAEKTKAAFDTLPPSYGRNMQILTNNTQAFFAAIDAALGKSAFVKWLGYEGEGGLGAKLTGKLAEAENRVTNFLNRPAPVVKPPSDLQAELNANQDKIEELQALKSSAGAASLPGAGPSFYDQQIAKLVERQKELLKATEDATDAVQRQNSSLADLQADRLGHGRRFSPLSIEPNPASANLPVVTTPGPNQWATQEAQTYKTAADYKKSHDTFIKPLDQDLEQIATKAKSAGEAAAKTAATEAAERKKLLDTISLQVTATENVAKATELGGDAVAKANAENDNAARIAAASLKLKGDQLEAFKKDSEAIRDNTLAVIAANEAKDRGVNAGMWGSPGGTLRQAETESMAAYDKYQKEEVGKANKTAETEALRYADIQRDILVQPFKDMASAVQSITANMFDEMLQTGKLSLSDLADTVDNLFRTTISNTLATIVTAPINEAIRNLATGQMQNAFTGTGGMFAGVAGNKGGGPQGWFTPGGGYDSSAYMQAGGLGAGAGFLGGTLYSQIAGKTGPGATTGGALGGGLGAAAGMYFGPGGAIVGGALGGIAGSFLGGMFGGGGEPNDNSQQKYQTGAGRITYSDSSFGAANRGITAGILGEVGSLQKVIEGLGGTVGKLDLTVQSGNKSGIKVGDQGFGSQEEAAAFALRKLLTATTGLTPTQQTIVGTTEGQSTAAISQDLAFAKTFDDLVFSGKEVDRTIRDLNVTFDAAVLQAGKLGLSQDALNAARGRETEKILEAQRRTERTEGAGFLQLTAPNALQKQLLAIDDGFRQAIDHYADLGYTVDAQNQLWAARQREMDQALKEFQRGQRTESANLFQLTTTSDLGRQIASIDEAFRQAVDHYRDLGYSVDAENQLWAARQREIDKAVVAQQRSQRTEANSFVQLTGASQLNKQIAAIDENFRQAVDHYRDLGYSVAAQNQLWAARQREINAAIEQQRRADRDLGSEFISAVSPDKLRVAILQSDTGFAQLSERLKDAGYSSKNLALVEEARLRTNEELIKQAQTQVRDQRRSIEQQVRSVRDAFDSMLEPLKAAANDNSALNPLTKVKQAQAKFREDLAGAQSGDTKSIQSLAGSASNLRGLVDSNLGTAGLGVAIRREISQGVGGVAAQLEQQQRETLASLPMVQRETTQDIIRAAKEDTQTLVDALNQLLTELRRQGRAA